MLLHDTNSFAHIKYVESVTCMPDECLSIASDRALQKVVLFVSASNKRLLLSILVERDLALELELLVLTLVDLDHSPDNFAAYA